MPLPPELADIFSELVEVRRIPWRLKLRKAAEDNILVSSGPQEMQTTHFSTNGPGSDNGPIRSGLHL